MSCVVNGIDIIYADNKLFRYYKNGSMRELKGCIKDGYRVVSINNNQYKYHRVVYNCYNPEWDIKFNNINHIDHIDRNPLNNNINNLRVVTHQQNQQNKNTKQYCWHKQKNKYIAYITVNYKRIHLGYYHTEEEARNAYLEARKRYNFI